MSEKVEQTFNKGESCQAAAKSTMQQPTGFLTCAKWSSHRHLNPMHLSHNHCSCWCMAAPLAAGNLRLLGTAVGGVFGYVVMLR